MKQGREDAADGTVPNSPTNWTSKTLPLQVVDYFSKPEVTKEQINKLLVDNSILTLEDLRSEVSVFCSYLERRGSRAIDA